MPDNYCKLLFIELENYSRFKMYVRFLLQLIIIICDIIFHVFLLMSSTVRKKLVFCTFKYTPPKKFREGNIFSCVCPHFCPWGSGVQLNRYLDLTIQGHSSSQLQPCPSPSSVKGPPWPPSSQGSPDTLLVTHGSQDWRPL